MKWNNRFIILFCLVTALLAGCTTEEPYVSSAVIKDTQNAIESDTVDGMVEGEQLEQVYVYVCGHVNNPGVYRLEQDARICDALELAGGVSEDGAGEALNQAEHVKDGQTLYVPGIQDMAEHTEESTEDGLLDINSAEKEDLLALPGIGESKADTILAYRSEHGPFDKIEDLMNIPGIKEGVFQKIKPYIKVL